MTRRSLSLLATTAAFVLLGGLHLEIASGRGLDGGTPGDASVRTAVTHATANINRSTKADRSAISQSAAEGRTITFEHPDLPSTTVAVRLWETVGAAKSRPVAKDNKQTPANKPRHAVACEGVVSALTEVAKHLEAGRCVT